MSSWLAKNEVEAEISYAKILSWQGHPCIKKENYEQFYWKTVMMQVYKVNVWKREAEIEISVVKLTELFRAIELKVKQVQMNLSQPKWF